MGTDYCTFSNEASYADGVNNNKLCGTTYSPSAAYTSLASGSYTQGFSAWNQPGGIILQLHYQDSRRWGCHTMYGGPAPGDAGCTSSGGCHCRVWVR